MNRKIFAENLLKRLYEIGMTQEELAKKVDYKSASSINNIINGTASPPYEKLEAFANALDMPLIELIGGEAGDALSEDFKSSKLIILAGLPGSGRSYAISKITEAHPDIVMVKRYSTRDAWISEKENPDTIEGATKETLKTCDIRGLGFGVEYGCHSKDIDIILSQDKSPIIVGGVALVNPLRKIYPNSLSIFLMADPSMQETVMLRQGHAHDVIHDRMEHQSSLIFNALNKSLYDFIIPNNYDGVAQDVICEIILKGNPDADVKGAINLKSLRR